MTERHNYTIEGDTVRWNRNVSAPARFMDEARDDFMALVVASSTKPVFDFSGTRVMGAGWFRLVDELKDQIIVVGMDELMLEKQAIILGAKDD